MNIVLREYLKTFGALVVSLAASAFVVSIAVLLEDVSYATILSGLGILFVVVMLAAMVAETQDRIKGIREFESSKEKKNETYIKGL